MPSFLRAVWFRNATLYAVLFLAVASLAGVLAYRNVESGLQHAVIDAVAVDQGAMMAEFEVGGLPALTEAVTERLAETSGVERFYALETSRTPALSGNIAFMPASSVFEGSVMPTAQNGGTTALPIHAIGSTVEFAGGRLFVGRNVTALDTTLGILRESFVLASALLFLAALALGVALGLHSERRIRAMAVDMRRVVESGMKDRMTSSRRSDEYERLADDINIMLDRLHGLMEGIRHVTTNIAHDLRTPLSRLRQNLEGLQSASAFGGRRNAALAKCVSEVDSVNNTFEALLRIAEIEDGSRRKAFRATDLSILAVELEELYADFAGSAGLKLTGDFEYGVRVWGDRDLLLQMGANLIENAIRHASAGGVIRIELKTSGRQAIVSVSDAGPGIPPAEHDKVFRRLYKGEASRGGAGQGLGLSLVAAIADLHFAKVKLLDNNPGLWVEIVLPLYSGSENGEP